MEEISIKIGIDGTFEQGHKIMKKMLKALDAEELIIINKAIVSKRIYEITVPSKEYEK